MQKLGIYFIGLSTLLARTPTHHGTRVTSGENTVMVPFLVVSVHHVHPCTREHDCQFHSMLGEQGGERVQIEKVSARAASKPPLLGLGQ